MSRHTSNTPSPLWGEGWGEVRPSILPVDYLTGVRQFDFGITTKEPTKKSITSARRGIEETGARFVAEIFVVVLRIETGQILDAAKLHGILTGNDITSAQPRCEVRVVIRMGRIGWHVRLSQRTAVNHGGRPQGLRRHERTLASVFENIFTVKDHHASRRIQTPLPRKQPQNNLFIRA